MPNIARIKQGGVWADMISVLPPVTSPNWKCYSTGKNPGKIGIFWWENIDWTSRRVYYPIARKFQNKEIWDCLGEAGQKVGIIGMPTTYPPKRVNGFLISAGPDASENKFCYPGELEDELKKQGWRSHPRKIISIDREKASQEIYDIIDTHFRVANILAPKYEVDFLMVSIFNINTLHHFFWDSLETKRAWEIVDMHIGELMNQNCNLILMSDHGSNKIESVFNINTWLKEEGYLRVNFSLGDVLYRLGIHKQRLLQFASKLRLVGLLRKIVPKGLERHIPSDSGEIIREAKAGVVNWRKSKALASGQGPIYLNPENADNEMLKKEIKQKLEVLIDPLTGKKVVEKVYSKEEIYQGDYLAEAPDLIIDQAKGVHIPGGIGQTNIFGSRQIWRAENNRTGLFMAYGPDIRPAGKIDNMSILDLAPTILHLMNIPVPDDMDGRVLMEIFREGSEPQQRKVRHQEIDMERERIRDKVKRLKHYGKDNLVP